MGNAGVTIFNATEFPLNIYLSMDAPHHYCNKVKPGESFTKYPGAVWYTVNADIDLKTNRIYSGKVLEGVVISSITNITNLMIPVANPIFKLSLRFQRQIPPPIHIFNEEQAKVALKKFPSPVVQRTLGGFLDVLNESKLHVFMRGVYCGDSHKILRVYGGPKLENGRWVKGDLEFEYS